MRVHVLTIFPELIRGFLSAGIPRIAVEKGKLDVRTVDLRSFTHDLHRTVDDRPYGGGPGMVMRPGPIFEAVECVEREHGPAHRILLTPAGRLLDQARLREIAGMPDLLLLCGRYEGIDERVRLGLGWDEISIGDYVLSGGEPAAMVLLDGVARLLPGVLGHPGSAASESFENGLLEAPHYTRPRVYRGMQVPETLVHGDHGRIAEWRHEQAVRLTSERRADLLRRADRRNQEF